MSKFTPGPWAIAFGGSESDDYAVIGSKHSDRAVCALEPGDYKPANAQLIASAPELYAALEECITSDRAMRIVQNDVAYMIRRFKAINAIVNSALAKARGE